MAKLSGPTIDARGDHGQCRHEFCMTITLHDLSGKCRRLQTKLLAYGALDSGIDMRMRAHRAADLTHANAFSGLRQPFLRAAKFVEHQREFQTEGYWFRV